MALSYPYQFSPLGRTALVADDQHVRDLIEQVLFTAPGERVMRPTLGSAVAQMVFAPSAPELASATQMLIQSSLQQWLGELIVVIGVGVSAVDATVTIEVSYQLRQTGQVQSATFSHAVGGAS